MWYKGDIRGWKYGIIIHSCYPYILAAYFSSFIDNIVYIQTLYLVYLRLFLVGRYYVHNLLKTKNIISALISKENCS